MGPEITGCWDIGADDQQLSSILPTLFARSTVAWNCPVSLYGRLFRQIWSTNPWSIFWKVGPYDYRIQVGGEINPSYHATFAGRESMLRARIDKNGDLLMYQCRLKCDRGQPCETCIRRGLSLSCNYPTASERSDRRLPKPIPSSNVQGRIAQLEKLVISLTSTLNTATRDESVSSAASIPAEVSGATGPHVGAQGHELPNISSNIADSFGRISLNNAEAYYVDGAHWTSILDGVCCFSSNAPLSLTITEL